MNKIIDVFENLKNTYQSIEINTTTILTVLFVVTILALYEFLIYRFVSHRSFYSKQFNILIAILPYFIATIILCLQSNIVITLGTIGALAIVRFRTAVKDPVDMLYILWSIYIGIICGCQLYEVAILTSIVVTILFIILENITFGRLPYVIIIHCNEECETKLKETIGLFSKKIRIKSRNYTSKGIDYAIEASIKQPNDLMKKLEKIKTISSFSIIEYDADDIV